ncbi:helix-turn-helix domain-containing protein, partial [Lactobacillus salivarius]|nr:helix-turn-helix domain-containing protein [Ligilactobacillus salivarius]
MLDISTIMRKYGFNESEIKVYLTLINHEQMTGYEVSKLSGVARSKVYNVLENLIQK